MAPLTQLITIISLLIIAVFLIFLHIEKYTYS